MPTEVSIVGAGPAGLAAAYELKKLRIPVRMLEKTAAVAASWRSRHDHLELNTFRGFSHQPGMPIPRRYGAFPAKRDYIAYLERYAEWLDVPIDFHVEVNRIERAEGHWTLATSSGAFPARHVVIATGSDSRPFLPEWPGQDGFQGDLIHASEFRNAEQYAGKSVLLVGGGNSAFDIGNYLARVPLKKSWISVRGAAAVVPKRMLGLPSQGLLVSVSWLPEVVQDPLIAGLSRFFVGDLVKLGFPKPKKGGLRKFREEGVTLAVDDGLARAIRTGVFSVVPPISHFSADEVNFCDDRTLRPDAIICATGYRPGLEQMVGHLDVLDRKGYPLRCRGEPTPNAPGLWFLGQNSSPYGNMNIRRREVRRLAANISRSA